MTSQKIGLFLFVAVALAAPARAIVELDGSFSVSDSDYLNQASLYPSVGEFGSGSGAVSGVLIASDWVLTAGHIAAALTVNVSTFTIGGNTYTVTGTTIYPTFSLSPTVHDDIAVVQLSAIVPNVTPATMYSGSAELTAKTTGVGAADWVGYGGTGTGLTGDTGAGRGTERAGTNDVDLYGYFNGATIALTNNPALGTMIVADFDNNTVGNNTLSPNSSPFVSSLESGFAVGDSGGGVFANFGSGNVLIGINSFNGGGISEGSGSQYSAYLGSTRVSAYSGWVASEIPEPGYGALAAALAAGLLAWRRKK